jgi:hypothetical protein
MKVTRSPECPVPLTLVENGRHRGGMVISVYGERGAKDRLLCIQMTPRDCSRERRLRCEG